VHPKQVLAKNCFANGKWLIPRKISFWEKTLFLGALFNEVKCISIFEIGIKDRFFDTPCNICQEKSFHLIEESVCTFSDLRSPKCKQPLNIF
jgi:hypothetical protein